MKSHKIQPEINEMLNELASSLIKAFNGQIMSIILYGSTSRGAAKSDSDIDISMLVKRGLSKADADQLSDIVVDLNLKYDKVFSVIDIEY